VAYDGQIYSVLATATYLLNEKTDLLLLTSFRMRTTRKTTRRLACRSGSTTSGIKSAPASPGSSSEK
jgi:hypothetical protein